MLDQLLVGEHPPDVQCFLAPVTPAAFWPGTWPWSSRAPPVRHRLMMDPMAPAPETGRITLRPK
jgi:hypothetical protein